MAIKVLVISNFRSYHSSRPEAEMFINLAKTGLKITIMTYGDSAYVEEFQKAGIHVIDFHPEKKFNKQEIGIIRKELIEGKYDIMHLFNSKSIVNGIRAAKGIPLRIVLYRGFAGHVHWYDPSAYLKYLHPRVDKIICNSKGVEESFHGQLFFDKRKAITIIKGHSLEWYKNYSPADIKEEFNIPENAFVVVIVANYRPMKGINYLLEAMNYLPEEQPIFLLLVGANMNNPQNMKIINRNKNNNRIILADHRDDTLNIVAACNAIVLSSIKGEGLNKAVIEAMALEKPAIVTNIPGNRDLVEQEENGLVVPPRNAKELARAILYLYENPDRCKQMGISARKHVATKLNLENAIIQTRKLYESLCR